MSKSSEAPKKTSPKKTVSTFTLRALKNTYRNGELMKEGTTFKVSKSEAKRILTQTDGVFEAV